MLNTLCRAGLVLAIGLLLSLPAAAQQDNDDTGGGNSDKCADELIQCVYDCTWLADDGEFAVCNQDCNEDFGICTRGDLAQTADPRPGGPRKPKGTHTTGIGTVTGNQVENACRAVGGVFANVANGFGCVNQSCGAGGNCVVGCIGSQCYAITPDPLPANVTLLGILQNGNNVVRGPKTGGAESDTKGDAGDPPPKDGQVIMFY